MSKRTSATTVSVFSVHYFVESWTLGGKARARAYHAGEAEGVEVSAKTEEIARAKAEAALLAGERNIVKRAPTNALMFRHAYEWKPAPQKARRT